MTRKSRVYLVCAFYQLLPGIPLYAQSDSILIQNSKAVDEERYKDIDGSPYYFSDWVKGSVLRSDGMTVRDVLLNYNGYTHEIDVKSGEKIHTLDKRWHLRVDVLRDNNPNLAEEIPVPNLIFQRGAHRDFSDRYSTILFLGKKYTLIKDCDIGKVQKEFNDVGKNIEILRFKDQSAYFLKKENVLIPIKLQKKRIAEAFENDARIIDYITTEKLDVGNESDLVRLVAFADPLE